MADTAATTDPTPAEAAAAPTADVGAAGDADDAATAGAGTTTAAAAAPADPVGYGDTENLDPKKLERLQSVKVKVLRTGMLGKHGGGAFTGWKKRFFKLTSDGIAYFEKEGGKIKGGFTLDEVAYCRVASRMESKRRHSFVVATTGARFFVLHASSDPERDAWVSAIDAARTGVGRKHDGSVPHHNIVIIGGGVAGLYTALKLIQGGVKDVVLYESRGALGGRIQTTRNDEGEPLFNDFAWRIGETNERMLALAKELGIELRKQYSPRRGSVRGSHSCTPKGAVADPPEHTTPPGRAPLSTFAGHALQSAADADRVDRESGYAGRTAQIAFPDETHGEVNFVPINGMTEFATALAAKLGDEVVHPNHRCKDIVRDGDEYHLTIVRRQGNDYSTFKIHATTVVLAAPPFALRQFSVAKVGLQPVLAAVHERRLGHVYVKCKEGPEVPDHSTGEGRIYRSLPDSILQQVISGDYGHGIFQAAYACDRFERVWRELQYQGPDVVKAEIQAQIGKIVEAGILPQLGEVEIEEVFLRIGWVHRWHIEAHVSGKNKHDLSLQAVYPNPSTLPQLHLVGEAFSAHQGWTEGALQTAEDCVRMIQEGRPGSGFSQPIEAGPATMTYYGLVMDTSEWAKRHPGGVGPIKFHNGEDVSELFDNFHAGWPAPLATLFGLQAGSLASSP
mmetsp:Transcript_7591/g.22374  ORF Transcript_7591/g.22374 Transcript_7591/m.22374 type:complete len:677 (+) Transcript_7591:106-2136(+)